MEEHAAVREYPLSEVRGLRVLGRTTQERVPLTLFWTGSGIEVRVRAGELWAEVVSDYEWYETWADVILDGALMQHFMLPKGRSTICLFRGTNPEEMKTVRLLRDTQAMPDDEHNLFQILALRTDGEFVPEPPQTSRLRLEFIGDSITSGEGCSGRIGMMDWNPSSFHAVHNYAYETAESVGAEYHCVSQCGWGVSCGWDGDVRHTLPRIYRKVCGVLGGARNAALGAGADWDFCRWQPDVVVINLGTNDDGAFLQPDWTDPVTGAVNHMRRNPDGSCVREDAQKVIDAVIQFLVQLRECNPHSDLIWCYGMIGQALRPVLEEAVMTYRVQSGDERAEFLLLPDAADLGYGSRGHAGRATHRAAARILAQRIRELHAT